MICVKCRSAILGGTKTWGYHCLSDSDCAICSRLRQDVSQIAGLEVCLAGNSLYWWKLGQLAHTRDTPRSYSITLTPDASKHPALKDVRRRTFHLLDRDGVKVTSVLDSRTNSAGALSQMKSWLRQCKGEHSRCVRSQKKIVVPKRLIDVGTVCTDKIVVVETDKLSTPVDKYMTLSHCWGDPELSPPILKLTQENEGPFTDPSTGIRSSRLPKNFRQAIGLTRRLGVRYIWIDALCIVQDNGEFHQEGQLMHQVYRNSFCNLAAADSGDSTGGLYRSRNSEDLIPQILETSESSVFGKRSWVFVPSDIWDDQLLEQSLYRRGWVFQERMLSPRMIHFTANQVFWDCASMSACEVFPAGLPESLDAAAAPDRHWRERLQIAQEKKELTGTADDSIEQFWKKAVRAYTACNLTRNIDRMPAIWSVAKLVRDEMRRAYDGQEYGVGLWSSYLHEQLAWRVMDPSKATRPEELTVYPTWSWASLIGEIEVQDRISDPNRCYGISGHDGHKVRYQLSEVSAEESRDVPDGANALQQGLETNSLAMKANLVEVRLRKVKKSSHSRNIPPGASHTNTYTLRPVHKKFANIHLTDDNFEVFPDTKPLSADHNAAFYLIILAGSEVKVSTSESMGIASVAPTHDLSRKKRNHSTRVTYGTGLVLVKASLMKDTDCHFRRIAACHFQGIGLSDFKKFIPHNGHGTDIWLV
ncbi:uncharacterized protein JN550_000631 [Neoarthrinium moseri]|uniref:uncharacterized protein n=1 Tax=Neoarthrinium moseri TaxID=1658444 RepID=UPI001FDDCEBD|nr:uncharacterized protein JN550_000631 [Neoarthrinium moseri]KAI1878449.1 hypothetical protein JN550_000631 [Neoarthrinium moseri]